MMRFNQTRIITDGDMSADVTSIGIDTQQMAIGSIQAVWSGTAPLGDMILQVSNDIVQVASGSDPAANVVNWTVYTGSTQSTSSGDGNYVWNVSDMGYRWIRLIYDRTSGTGTINAVYFSKGV